MPQDTLSRPTPAGQDAIAEPIDAQSLPTLESTSRQAIAQPLAIQVSATEQHDTARLPPAADDPQSPLSRSTIHSGVLGSPVAATAASQPAPFMDRALGQARRSITQTARLFFSAEGKELRHVTGIFFRLGFSMVQVRPIKLWTLALALNLLFQVVVIVVMLALASSKFKSKNQQPWDTNVSEFEDCDKLGIWNALWAVRASFGCGMIIWEWKRYLAKRERALRRRTADIELEDSTDQHLQWGTEVRGPPENPPTPRSPLAAPDPVILHSSQHRGAEPARFNGTPLPPDTAPPNDPPPRRPSRREPRPAPTPGDALFDRYVLLALRAI